MNQKLEISVIIPVFKCKDCIEELYIRLKKVFLELDILYEIIFIDDFCPQNSWKLIKKIAESDYNVRGIKFYRNFGQQNAINAGIRKSLGKYGVIMDGDLQDNPEIIKLLYPRIKDKYDVVLCRRNNRKDTFLKKINSKIFFLILNYFSDIKYDSKISNFGIYSRKVIDFIKTLKEKEQSFVYLSRLFGFKIDYIDVEHSNRYFGETSYNLKKLLNLAINIIISQSNKPLLISIGLGFLISFISFLYIIFLFYRYFVLGIPVEGWTSMIVSLYMLSGILFINLGILGLYIGKVFNQVKNRPEYVIEEEI